MAPVQLVFISSIQRDYGDVREAVCRAVESVGMRPLMAELVGAHPESPQRALLDLVADCDIFLLIVGPRYSEPTEDEFDEARRLAKIILVLVQTVEREPEQEVFLKRVSGDWSGGRFRGAFDGPGDVALEAVRALTNSAGGRQDLAPAAQDRARELATGEPSPGSQGPVARVALSPLVAGSLLDAVALDDPSLGPAIADLVRSNRLVEHNVGIETRVTGAGVSIAPAGSYTNAVPSTLVAADGAVVCEIQVGGPDDLFGWARINPDRLRAGIASAGSFALGVWERIDPREEVQQVAVALAIPDAPGKVFGASTGSATISMGWGMPQVVSVPESPLVVRRAEVGGDALAGRLVAEVKRVFADANAVDG